MSPEIPQSLASSVRKRTRNSTWVKKKHQFLEASLKVLEKENIPPESELQEMTFGKNVDQQLQEVEHRQKIIAQKLISDVLYHAKLGNLTDSSFISRNYQSTAYPIDHTCRNKHTPNFQLPPTTSQLLINLVHRFHVNKKYQHRRNLQILQRRIRHLLIIETT